MGYWYHLPLLKGGDTLGDNTLMLLFQGGLFLLTLLTFIVLLIDRLSKK